jgi:hypothetical protein
MLRRGAFLLVVFTALAGCGDGRPSYLSRSARKAELKASAEQLERTVITSHLEYPIEGGTNVLWCATFQLAWNELCKFLGEDVHLEDEPDMVSALNRRSVTGDDLDEDTYVAVAGVVGEKVLEKIEKELEAKFRGRASPELAPPPGSLPPDWLVAYAYLFANLPFEWAFERSEYGLRFGDTEVECFGIIQYLPAQVNEEKAAGQLLIYDYQGESDFLIELKTQLADHHLYLAKISPKETLEKTVLAVQERIRSASSTNLEGGNSLMIPVVNFDLTRDYTEIIGKRMRLKNPEFHEWPILIARQQIRLKLDETGAVLKSEAMMAAGIGEDLVFDQPFLIMLRYREREVPYFALWVDNPEILVPFRE